MTGPASVMTRRLGAALFAAALATATGWWGGAAGAAGAAARVTRVGWWSQQPGAQAQPAGGFQVAYGPQGPQSEAAVEVAVDPSAGPVTLVLDEGASVGDNLAAVDACLVRGNWTAADPGAWTAAPVYDCSSKASLTRDSSTSTWHADVSGLVTPGGSTSLMLIPVAQAVGAGVSPAFQLTFSSATASAPQGGAGPAGPGAAPASPGTGTDYLSPADASAPGAPAASGPAAALPGLPLDAPAPVAPPAPAVAPAPTPPAGGSFVATPSLAAGPADHGGGRPWWRLALLVPLSAAVGAGAIEARRRLVPAA